MPLDPDVLVREFTAVVEAALAPIKRRLDALEVIGKTATADHDEIVAVRTELRIVRDLALEKLPR